MTGDVRSLVSGPAARTRWWGAGGAPLGLLAETAAEVHGAVPLWLDWPLSIAPQLGCELDWSQAATVVVQASGALVAAGVRAGDRVAIVKAHNVDVVLLAQAAARLGAIPALIAPEFDPATVAVLLDRLDRPVVLADAAAITRHGLTRAAGVRLLIGVDPADGDGDQAWAQEEGGVVPLHLFGGAPVPPPRPVGEDDLVAVTHTSGTTGVPKLIRHTTAGLAGQSAIQVLGGRALLRRHDVIATCLTTAHARTLSGLATIAAVGAPHLAMVDPNPASAARLLARHRPTLVETFPNVFLAWERFAEHPGQPLANVRVFLSTFDAAHPRTIRRLLAASHRRFPLYAQAYAQSETGAIALSFRTRRVGVRGDARTVGWPVLAFNQARLIDPATGRRVRRPHRPGRIQVTGPGRFDGYLGETDRTRAGQHGRWWDTGDLGARTLTGQLRLDGRAVDHLDALPDYLALEDLLLDRLDELTELVLTADHGGRIVPVVCTRDDRPLDPDRWRAVTAGLPQLASPRQLRWAELPTTATWKVRRPALRALLDPPPDAHSADPQTASMHHRPSSAADPAVRGAGQSTTDRGSLQHR